MSLLSSFFALSLLLPNFSPPPPFLPASDAASRFGPPLLSPSSHLPWLLVGFCSLSLPSQRFNLCSRGFPPDSRQLWMKNDCARVSALLFFPFTFFVGRLPMRVSSTEPVLVSWAPICFRFSVSISSPSQVSDICPFSVSPTLTSP